MPTVSVVLPAYNSELFIHDAIDSILAQTYQDFELLLIDDGSTDRTSEIIQEYGVSDHRVRVHRFEQNQGLISALNWGCQNARGQYIAIMHSDDISLPSRLAEQVEFLELHPEIGVLGAACRVIDRSGRLGASVAVPVLPGLIRWMLYFGNCIVHPTVMMRRAVIEAVDYYSPDAFLIDDYNLWLRISRSFDIANLPTILLRYRYWPGNATALHHQQVEKLVTVLVQQEVSGLLGRFIPTETVTRLRRIHDPGAGISPTNLEHIRELQGIVNEIFQVYTGGRSALAVREKQLVANDVALKLMVLSRFAIRYSFWESLHLIGCALQLNPWTIFQVIRILHRKIRRGIASLIGA